MDNESGGPEYQWTKDKIGRVINEALGIWFVERSYRDGYQGVFLPISEPHDGKQITSFWIGSTSRELSDDEKSANPGVDYEILFKISAAHNIEALPSAVNHYTLIENAIVARRGVPTLYQKGKDRNYYALVQVEFGIYPGGGF